MQDTSVQEREHDSDYTSSSSADSDTDEGGVAQAEGGDDSQARRGGFSELYLASREGNAAEVLRLLGAKADAVTDRSQNLRRRRRNETALMPAANRGHLEVARILLDARYVASALVLLMPARNVALLRVIRCPASILARLHKYTWAVDNGA